MKIRKAMLNEKITYTNKILDTTITNRNFNGYNHLTVNDNNIFAGSNKECVNFLDALVQFHLLTK